MWYYGITTLSTIGYGDFGPKAVQEKIICLFVLLIGVTIFSFIMGNFIEILMNYKSINNQGSHKDLSKWVALLAKFNDASPLSREIITAIEDFFAYYWVNNRL